jgi:hypothetical protein
MYIVRQAAATRAAIEEQRKRDEIATALGEHYLQGPPLPRFLRTVLRVHLTIHEPTSAQVPRPADGERRRAVGAGEISGKVGGEAKVLSARM